MNRNKEIPDAAPVTRATPGNSEVPHVLSLDTLLRIDMFSLVGPE